MNVRWPALAVAAICLAANAAAAQDAVEAFYRGKTVTITVGSAVGGVTGTGSVVGAGTGVGSGVGTGSATGSPVTGSAAPCTI